MEKESQVGEKRFSLIVPVYNRPDEVRDLMESLARQTCKDFEIVVVEDGSTVPCGDVVSAFPEVDSTYIPKPNEGRSIARNAGMEKAKGSYFVFVDSDCVLPADYFEKLSRLLDTDCFGGPDAADKSFTPKQHAINYAMTSFLTTGGIRGGKVCMEKFVPRTFNMGFSRKVYEKVGGFREMFSEDIDMSTRIRQAGFSIGLLHDVFVYHKRRVDFKKFWHQVHVFGMSRVTLKLLYPDSLKLVHLLPAIAVLIGAALLVLGIVISLWFFLPLGLYLLAIFATAWYSTKSPEIAMLAIPASVIQICGYGTGFIRAYVVKILLGKGRDINQEIEMRKGK